MLSLRPDGASPLPSSAHRLQLGLPGYLILFAPLAFVPQRQSSPSEPLSLPVFLPISTHFTAPLEVPHTPILLKSPSLERSSMVEPWDFTPYLSNRLRTL